MQQFGLELQYVVREWAFKLEPTQRQLDSGDFNSLAAGLEYTFSNLGPWGKGIGVLAEYLWNNRRDASAPDGTPSWLVLPGEFLSPFEDDIFVATRFELNDVNSARFLAGMIHDLESGTTLGSLEGTTRVAEQALISLNIYLFSNVPEDSSFFFSRNDDLIELKFTWYFQAPV